MAYLPTFLPTHRLRTPTGCSAWRKRCPSCLPSIPLLELPLTLLLTLSLVPLLRLFLQVEDSGKVQRLRKQCPNCGPGTFMANHFDRVYCGKCTTTFLFDKDAAPAGKGKGKK